MRSFWRPSCASLSRKYYERTHRSNVFVKNSSSMIDKKFNTQSILQNIYVQLFFYDRLYPPTRSTSSCKMTHAEKAKMANKVQSPPGKAMESIKAFCRVISVDMVILDSNSLADFR